MSLYVIDCSVAVKWYVPETHSQAALALLDESHQLHAPDLLLAEFGNTLWKKRRLGELTDAEVRSILTAFWTVPLEVHPLDSLLEGAVELALRTDRTVYDSMYVALAILLDSAMVTADEVLIVGLRASGFVREVRHVAALT